MCILVDDLVCVCVCVYVMCMYVYMCVHVCICVCACTHVCVCTSVHNMCKCVYVCICVCVCMCVCECTQACTCACKHVCMYAMSQHMLFLRTKIESGTVAHHQQSRHQHVSCVCSSLPLETSDSCEGHSIPQFWKDPRRHLSPQHRTAHLLVGITAVLSVLSDQQWTYDMFSYKSNAVTNL